MQTEVNQESNFPLKREENHFDLLRLLSAVLVVFGHARILGAQPPIIDPENLIFQWDMGRTGLLCFFIMSGYLVTGSLERRKNPLVFMAFRGMRIFPALVFCMLVMGFLIGPILSNLFWGDYFFSNETWQFIKNISVYRLHYKLPGVFETNPGGSSVNGSLWTIPYEFTCYGILAITGIFSILKNRYFTLALFLILIILHFTLRPVLDTIVLPIIGVDLKRGLALFLFFLSGSLYFKFKELFIWKALHGWVALFVVIFTSNNPLFELFELFFLPWIIFSIAFSKKKFSISFIRKNDLSYGLYLWAFPCSQIIMSFFQKPMDPFLLGTLTLAPALLIAALSWFVIEKPALDWGRATFKQNA